MAPVLALSGFMGSGKSAVGRALADRLHRPFFDLDAEVEAAAGVSIEELFAEGGESGFRSIEHRALEHVLHKAETFPAGIVLALGGGTVTWPASARRLAEKATVVLLEAPVEVQWARAAGTGRPLARSEELFVRLAEERAEVYRDTADVVADTTGLDVEAAAAAVLAALAEGGTAYGHASGTAAVSWTVDLTAPSRASTIVGGPGALSVLAERCAMVAEAGLRVYVVSDETVMRLHGGSLAGVTRGAVPDGGLFVFEPGESSKNGATAMRCWEWLASSGARRDDIVLAFGGGVIGDLAGFVAATYLRGVRLWQVPTTLLAQVDSSVGGKVAINLPLGKNLVGAFYQPELVVADQDFLTTLPSAEFSSGLGEVVKYALLIGEEMLSDLERTKERLAGRRMEDLSDVVARCVRFKAEVVVEDETDHGRRAILNLGHTVGHALESVLGYGVLPHGAAVGLGLLAALAVSEAVTGLPRDVRARTEALLSGLGLPTRVSGLDADAVLRAVGHDKKMGVGGLAFVCLQDVGRPVWGIPVERDLIGTSVEVIRA